ncbi:MAG: efflux RND transporter periplasmic adaptor subunit [Deltaproteobacteria bacterium]|nr:efflux RND transporter periplasmic adaptor subunit [Deltaproteobacteria bacterium]
MKTVKVLIKYVVLPVFTVFLLFYLWPKKLLDVEYTKLSEGDIEEVVTPLSNAVLQAEKFAKIRSSTTGEIEKIMFRKGEKVKKGDLIIKLKNDELFARLKLSEANLKAGIAQLRQTKIRSSNIQKSLERAERLFSEKIVSESNLEQTKTESQVMQEALNISEANILQLESQMRIAKSLYDNTFIRAPFDGVLSDIYVEIGEYLVPGTPIYDLFSDQNYYLSARFDEVDAARITTGMKVRLKSDTLSGRITEGKVVWISPVVSSDIKASRGVEVHFAISSIEPDMRVGMTFEAEVIVNTKNSVKYLPSAVIIGKHGEKYVFIINGDTLKKKPVETGISNWERTEILSGVEGTDMVAVPSSSEELKDGMRINKKTLRKSDKF